MVTLPDGRALVSGGMALAAAGWTTLATSLYVAVMDDGT